MDKSAFNFETAFVVTTIALRINRSYPFIKRNIFWGFQFVPILILSVLSWFLLTNSVLFYDIPEGRFTDASKNGTMAIVALTISAKYSFLLYYQKYMKDLIEIVNEDYRTSESFEADERDVVVAYSKTGAKISMYWLISATMTGMIFPLKAFYQMAHYYWAGEFRLVPLFDMRYPDRMDVIKNIPAIFWLYFSICSLFGLYATTMYIGFDPLVPIFLMHICGQLNILIKRMGKIFDENSSTEETNEKLKQINMKLQDLYRMVDNIKNKFTVLFEYTLKTTTFLLPLAMFQVVEDLQKGSINFEFISFFIASILHFYIPCYYSDKLMEQSDNLRVAIYSCGWEKHPDSRARKSILIMLTRTTAPLVLSTVFYPICLDTFADMCRQSYAIFNIMNAAVG